MSLTVALVAYRRPAYLEACLGALLNCIDMGSIVDRIICSVDDSLGQGASCYARLQKLERQPTIVYHPMKMESYIIPTKVIGQVKRRGIVGNTILAMKAAFDGGAENVLMLEDDAVLKKDALLLAEYFCNLDRKHASSHGKRYTAFGLSAHGAVKEVPPDPSALSEFTYLPCPFAYVVNRDMWPFMLKNWCTKEYHPAGWSWSMTFAARSLGYRFLGPYLSRCENIGREAGENETPETWDRTQTGIPFSDGDWRGSYYVKRFVPDEMVSAIDAWMEAEIKKDPAQKWPSFDEYPGWLGMGCPEEIEEARKLL